MHSNSVSKHLSDKSQDKKVSKTRHKNLENNELSIQINVAFLMCQLKKNQRDLLCAILEQFLDRENKRQQNNETHALTKTPTNAAHVQKY